MKFLEPKKTEVEIIPTIYNYKPTDDLTIQELSDMFRVLFVSLIEGIQGHPVVGKDDLQIDDAVFAALPTDLRRHFTKFSD